MRSGRGLRRHWVGRAEMTNTLHRQGAQESLARDYVVFLTPAGGINREGCGEKNGAS